MKHRVAVVTGASSGIGSALSLALAERGTHVVLVARSVERLEELAGRVRAAGGEATVIAADLSQPRASQVVFDDLARRQLAVDTLVNNAGFGYWGGFEGEPLDDVSSMLQVNVVALAELTRLLVPSLLARGGSVLNIASAVAFQPAPFMAVYGATKAFVLSFSEALWGEYRRRGLHVTAVCPGPVETPFIDALATGVRRTPVFRSLLTVDEVVASCLRALDSSSPSSVVGIKSWFLAQASRFSTRALTARIGATLMVPSEIVPALSSGSRS